MADDIVSHSGGDLALTDGGLETTLIFVDGLDLPDFAAFPLLDSDEGRAALDRYYAPYLDLAARLGTGFVVDTPTWRASSDWGARLGYDEAAMAAVNRDAIEYAAALAARWPSVAVTTEGMLGPRGDGYAIGATMTGDEAAAYHLPQLRAFAEAGADSASVLTMTYADEAVGVVRAAGEAGLPVAVSFTVETDGRLPSGQALADAVREVDEQTDAAAAYFMVNCAHPTHFAGVLAEQQGADWLTRVQGIRANASTLSHAELDEATELDRGDVPGLARHYAELRDLLPALRLVGGCCGTDDAHVTAIAEELLGRPPL